MKIVHTYIRNMGITQEGKDNFTKLNSLDRWGLASLARLGHDVTLVCGSMTKERREFMCKGVKIIELPLRYQFTSTSKLIKGLRKELMNIEADVFHAHHYGLFVAEITATVAKYRGIPCFLTLHNTFNEKKGAMGVVQKGYLAFMSPFMNMFTNIFFISNFIKDSPNFMAAQKKRKALVRNYVPAPPVLDIPRRTNSIVYLGGVKPVKGVDILIKAFNRLDNPDLELHIIGSFHEHLENKKYLDSLAAKSKGKVTFYGPLFGEEKWGKIYAATALVVPSRKECFCNVVIEGMACGTPVIVSNGEALPETQGGHGLVFDLKKGEKDLAEKLKMLLDNPALREKFSASGLKYSKNFTTDKIAMEFAGYYQRALSKK